MVYYHPDHHLWCPDPYTPDTNYDSSSDDEEIQEMTDGFIKKFNIFNNWEGIDYDDDE